MCKGVMRIGKMGPNLSITQFGTLDGEGFDITGGPLSMEACWIENGERAEISFHMQGCNDSR